MLFKFLGTIDVIIPHRQTVHQATLPLKSTHALVLRPFSDSLQVKLGEFLPRVLDGSADTVILKDPPKVHVSQAHDLCSRLAAVMKSIHNTSVVAVK